MTLEIPAEGLVRGALFAGRYEIIEELGTGGTGSVFRAEDTKIRQEVALKLVRPEIASSRKTIERFRNEIKTARMIAHRNVCRMFGLGEEKGTYFFTRWTVSVPSLMRRRVVQREKENSYSPREKTEEGRQDYSQNRPHSALGNVPPEEYAAQVEPQKATLDRGLEAIKNGLVYSKSC